MNGTYLTGLEGTNPLGFLAALGVQIALQNRLPDAKLWWSSNVTPFAIVDDVCSMDCICKSAAELFEKLLNGTVLNPRTDGGNVLSRVDELKLSQQDVRLYLEQCEKDSSEVNLASALIAEGSKDGTGASKPTDLYFCAGNQKFLDIARKVVKAGNSTERLKVGLIGPWDYKSKEPTLGWDVSDDRVYALRAVDPTTSTEKKHTNPSVEALALLGLSLFPVYAKRDRTLTQGCSGQSWKSSSFSWPLWGKPAHFQVVKSLLAHAFSHSDSSQRLQWYPGWAITRILRSNIRRNDQGGYGTFGPPEIVWDRDTA